MSVKDFTFSRIERKSIVKFVEKHHYSHNMNGVIGDFCFGLFDNEMIGAMVFGRLAMRNQYKKYCQKEEDIIELRRLVCIDETPKNTESYFIGAALRWLSKNTTIKWVLSYADTTYGHTGIIYKASNFTLLGQTQAIKVIKRLSDGRIFHDKTIRTKYKGELKPFAKALKQDLEEGRAVYCKTKPKNIYIYELRR